jgi:hypothetical protein
LCLALIASGHSLGTKQKNRPPFCTENGAPTHVRFGGVQPLTKPCSESDPARTRIGRVGSNLLDARLVQLLILASLRVVHPQASSPSFKGALRQSSPKVASPLAIFNDPPCCSTLHCVPAARRLSPSSDEVCSTSVLALEPNLDLQLFTW